MKADNTFIAYPKTKEQVSALKAFMRALKIKFEVSKEAHYKPEFVAKILEGEKQIAEGKSKRVEQADLKEYLGL